MTHRLRRYRPVLALLLLPSLLLIGVFSYYPAVRSLIGGFYQWNGFTPPSYAGISQFKEYIQAPNFGTEVKNVAMKIDPIPGLRIWTDDYSNLYKILR